MSDDSYDRRSDNARLDRIEEQLRVLTDALLKLVAVETRQDHLAEDIIEIKSDIRNLEDRVNKNTNTEATQQGSSGMMREIFIAVVAIAITYLVTTIMGDP